MRLDLPENRVEQSLSMPLRLKWWALRYAFSRLPVDASAGEIIARAEAYEHMASDRMSYEE